jgi:hypothetical protein
MDRVARAVLSAAATGDSAGAKALRRMVETGDRGPTLHPVEEPGEQTSLLDGPQTGATHDGAGARTWTEGELRVMGEQIRDYLRKVARRAVAAFMRGGIERRDAELYVHGDLRTVAAETWQPPESEHRRRRPAHSSGGASGEDTSGA